MTTTTYDLTPQSAQILKTNSRGHIQFPPEMREALLDRFESSGMSGADFAKHYNLSYSTFATWRQKRKLSRGKADKTHFPAQGIVEAEIREEQSSVLHKALPGGASLQIGNKTEAGLAAELLKALEARTWHNQTGLYVGDAYPRRGCGVSLTPGTFCGQSETDRAENLFRHPAM